MTRRTYTATEETSLGGGVTEMLGETQIVEDDRHRALAEQLSANWMHGDQVHRQWLRDMIVPALAAAFVEVERGALERAIDITKKHALTIPRPLGKFSLSAQAYAVEAVCEVGDAIRALIPTPTAPPEPPPQTAPPSPER